MQASQGSAVAVQLASKVLISLQEMKNNLNSQSSDLQATIIKAENGGR